MSDHKHECMFCGKSKPVCCGDDERAACRKCCEGNHPRRRAVPSNGEEQGK